VTDSIDWFPIVGANLNAHETSGHGFGKEWGVHNAGQSATNHLAFEQLIAALNLFVEMEINLFIFLCIFFINTYHQG
jgi:hypothetical protein